jgi:hypothetical protein
MLSILHLSGGNLAKAETITKKQREAPIISEKLLERKLARLQNAPLDVKVQGALGAQ